MLNLARTLGFLLAVSAALASAASAQSAARPAGSSFSGMPAEGEALARSCIDMDGKVYEWRWSNVPFASSCTQDPPQKFVTAPNTEACYRDCSDTLIACYSSAMHETPIGLCFDRLFACTSRCKGVEPVSNVE
jgi:hypothetical protein